MVGLGYFFIELFQNYYFYVLTMHGLWSPLRHVGIKLCFNFSLESFHLTLKVQLVHKYFRKVISKIFIFDYPMIWVLKFQRIELAYGTW